MLLQLLTQLPKVETEDLENGDYYLNLRNLTGRKPHDPRAGDILMDGTRGEMTAQVYDAMARFKNEKFSQWERYFDFQH